MDSRAQSDRLGSELLHPYAGLALGVLVLNDHVLKGAGLLPGSVTGKLSDFAGLFLFPVLLFVGLDALGRQLDRAWGRTSRALVAGLASALGFALVKLHPGVNAWVSSAWGPMLLDPGDLCALPMTALAVGWLRRPPRFARAPGRAARTLATALAALACAATSRPLVERGYPAWQVDSLGARQLGCARVQAWISKSGKEGVGVSLSARKSGSAACRVEVTGAELEIDGARIGAAERPRPVELDHDDRTLYVPFVFDNQALWNAGRRRGTLTLNLRFDGQTTETLHVALTHRFEGPHRYRDPHGPQPPPVSSRPLLMADPDAPLAPPDAGGPP